MKPKKQILLKILVWFSFFVFHVKLDVSSVGTWYIFYSLILGWLVVHYCFLTNSPLWCLTRKLGRKLWQTWISQNTKGLSKIRPVKWRAIMDHYGMQVRSRVLLEKRDNELPLCGWLRSVCLRWCNLLFLCMAFKNSVIPLLFF